MFWNRKRKEAPAPVPTGPDLSAKLADDAQVAAAEQRGMQRAVTDLSNGLPGLVLHQKKWLDDYKKENGLC